MKRVIGGVGVGRMRLVMCKSHGLVNRSREVISPRGCGNSLLVFQTKNLPFTQPSTLTRLRIIRASNSGIISSIFLNFYEGGAKKEVTRKLCVGYFLFGGGSGMATLLPLRGREQ